ncbi:MAG: hypothetical protein LPK07_16650, partial [Hymenobacteraceae bacterium]|nr:hypothetical protein [Hymenobacteraceae bacterium]
MLLLLGLLTAGAKAQTSTQQELQWQGYEGVLPSGNLPSRVPTFRGAAVDPVERLPYLRIRIPGARLDGFRLAETAYQPFSTEEQKLLSGHTFAQEPKISLANGTENKQPVTLVSILPIRRNPQTNQLEKLVKFGYTYTLQQPKAEYARTSSTGSFATSSVLSSGNWYKLAVTSTGMYKIDKGVLQALGVNTQGIAPSTIQLYGNGGGMLPQPNGSPRPDDLIENAILVAGEEDGRFDDADYILFYAQGPHTWQYDAAAKLFRHQTNVYSDTAFYFLRIGAAPGARVSSRS